jgi:hypothetical protein
MTRDFAPNGTSSDRDLNPVPSEYEAGMLPLLLVNVQVT